LRTEATVTARPLLKAGYYAALQSIGLEGALLRKRIASPDTALVLNFHRISPEANPYWPPMKPQQFDRLLGYLRANCEVVTFAQLRDPPSLPRRPRVVLSFDDGHRDFVDYALPILDAHGLRANHNLIVDSVEHGVTPWMTKVVDALRAASVEQVRALRIPGLELRLDRDEDHSKAVFGARLTASLKAMTRAERATRCTELQRMIDGTDRFTAVMSRADALSLSGLHELGAHSVDHETLSLLPEHEFTAQVERCRIFMEGLGVQMRIFAFPHGMHTARQVELLRARDVEHVLLVEEAPTRVDTGVYARITMYGETDAELRVRALGYRASVRLGDRRELGGRYAGG
jgi:peptidoglycan/xylan/chitin deacetylase (PgdA/CDA1 family)